MHNAQCVHNHCCFQKQLPMHWQLLFIVVLLFRCFSFSFTLGSSWWLSRFTSLWSRDTEVHWVGCLPLVSVLLCFLTLPLLKNFFHCLFTMFSIHNRIVTALFFVLFYIVMIFKKKFKNLSFYFLFGVNFSHTLPIFCLQFQFFCLGAAVQEFEHCVAQELHVYRCTDLSMGAQLLESCMFIQLSRHACACMFICTVMSHACTSFWKN